MRLASSVPFGSSFTKKNSTSLAGRPKGLTAMQCSRIALKLKHALECLPSSDSELSACPGVSDSAGLVWGARVCGVCVFLLSHYMAHQRLSNAAVAGPAPRLCEALEPRGHLSWHSGELWHREAEAELEIGALEREWSEWGERASWDEASIHGKTGSPRWSGDGPPEVSVVP